MPSTRPSLLPSLLALLLAAPAAALPLEFTQEGLVLDAEERPVEGVHRVRVRLYAEARGGQALFQEVHPQVEFFNGYYAVAIGSIEGLDPALFAREALYLGVIIDGGDELSPRTALRLVPGAFYAHTAANVVGDITPRSVSIDGVGVVIDGQGRWVGDPTGLRGPAGPAGPEGPQGPRGPAGAAGGDGSPDTPQQVRAKLVQVDGAGSGVDADLLDGQQASAFVRTAAQVLERLRTVDGRGSGVDADRIDGLDSSELIDSPEQIRDKLKVVDGQGSGIDADRIDGVDSAELIMTPNKLLAMLTAVDGQGSGVDADRLDGLDSSDLITTPQEILAGLRQVDGQGSGIDADRIDGIDSAALVRADDPAMPERVVQWLQDADGAGSGVDADRLDGLDSSRFMRVDRDTGTAGALTVGGRINSAAGMVVQDGARVGIGVVDPQAELHVNGTIIADEIRVRLLRADVIQLNPLDRPPAPAGAGMLYFDAGTRGLRYHDGQRWQNVGVEGARGSCREILESGASLGSGDYLVDLDGDGPQAPVEVYCDMETDGGGWTRITPCLAQQVLGGQMVAVDRANTQGIDGSCRPYTRDSGGQAHTYHYTFAVPFGFREFYLDDYEARANASQTSDFGPGTFVQGDWDVAYGGSKGDIGLGTAGQNGPITSFVRYFDANFNCQNCRIAFPRNGRVFDLGRQYDTFRMGWGERGSQSEGWYPWWSGFIMVR